MTILKCKMCGGELEIHQGETVAECIYCGTKQTVPLMDDDKKAAIYERANRLRANADFDRAFSVYEGIAQAYPTDAEAFWGELLCKYGIEYVDDPATGKKIPTCHRSSYTSVLDDETFAMVMENADPEARKVYRDQAKQIEEIRKGIIQISSNEEPYDVFICYKETDENGERTPDSVLAQEVYDELIEKGYRVFFSRITLEDKLGEEYEPYIFAALNSAKVMLVFGTDYEYFNAPWVKNEWSRFLDLMGKGEKKYLIPCYKDIDAYDMPKEFQRLQSQDMSKIGWIQDLVRGVRKIVHPSNASYKLNRTNTSDAEPLLQRAYIFLEDGNFREADEYCEKVLDKDPKNANAYLVKLMAQLHVRKVEDLKNCSKPFDSSDNYQKVVRFGDEKIVSTLNGYISYINERNENDRITSIYNNAVLSMKNARTEEAFRYTASEFEKIPAHKDSKALAERCLAEAEICRKDSIYDSAISHTKEKSIAGFEKAISLFNSIPDWRDSKAQSNACYSGIKKIKEQKEADRIEQERLAEEKRKADELAAKRKRKALIIWGIIFVVCAIVLTIVVKVVIPNNNYNNAVALMEKGDYELALAEFEKLGDYKDSEDRLREVRNITSYEKATSLMKEGQYKEAKDIFETIKDYSDASQMIDACTNEINYQDAITAYKNGDYNTAFTLFEKLAEINYKDSAEQLNSVEKVKADFDDYIKTYSGKFVSYTRKSKYSEEEYHDDSIGVTINSDHSKTTITVKLDTIKVWEDGTYVAEPKSDEKMCYEFSVWFTLNNGNNVEQTIYLKNGEIIIEDSRSGGWTVYYAKK